MFLCASEDEFLQGLHSEAKQRVLEGVASYSEYNFHYCSLFMGQYFEVEVLLKYKVFGSPQNTDFTSSFIEVSQSLEIILGYNLYCNTVFPQLNLLLQRWLCGRAFTLVS